MSIQRCRTQIYSLVLVTCFTFAPPPFPTNLVSHYMFVLGVRSATVVQNGWSRFVGLLDGTLVSHYAFLFGIAEYFCICYHTMLLYLMLDYVGTFTPPPIPTNLVLDYTFVFRVRCATLCKTDGADFQDCSMGRWYPNHTFLCGITWYYCIWHHIIFCIWCLTPLAQLRRHKCRAA